MMFHARLICIVFYIYYVESQSTFGPLSTAATTATGFSTLTTKITFGTLSTAPTSTTGSPVAACPTNFCQNGAACLILNGRDIVCTCNKDFTGSFCETPVAVTPATTTTSTTTSAASVSLCPNNICQNGGQCLILNGKDVKCFCNFGFTGFLCEEVLVSVSTTSTSTTTLTTTTATTVTSSNNVAALCSINVCLNGGQCLILNGNDLLCICSLEYTGTLCETNLSTGSKSTTTTSPSTGTISECPVNVCQNGGTCLIINGVEVVCNCINDFTGPICEINSVKESSTTLTTTLTTTITTTITPATTITTTTMTTITTTTTKIVPIALCPININSCLNGGQCLLFNGVNIYCSCISGFTGEFCESQITTTTSTTTTTPAPTVNCPGFNICQNGGECLIINGNEVFCKCSNGFYGLICETFPMTTSTVTTAIIPTITKTVSTTSTTETSSTTTVSTTSTTQTSSTITLSTTSTTETSSTTTVSTTSTTETTSTTIVSTTSTTETSTTTTETTTSSISCPPNFDICQNGGECLIVNGIQVQCICESGFIGTFCETSTATTTTSTTAAAIVFCPPGVDSICKNDALCLILNGNQIQCNCASGFTGSFCDTPTETTTSTTTEVEFCSSNPCQNDGICLNDSKQCECSTGFYGLFCETQSCSPNPCQNDHTCIFLAKPKCLCTSFYTGSYCETLF